MSNTTRTYPEDEYSFSIDLIAQRDKYAQRILLKNTTTIDRLAQRKGCAQQVLPEMHVCNEYR